MSLQNKQCVWSKVIRFNRDYNSISIIITLSNRSGGVHSVCPAVPTRSSFVVRPNIWVVYGSQCGADLAIMFSECCTCLYNRALFNRISLKRY